MNNFKLARAAFKWIKKNWESDLIMDISQTNFDKYLQNGDIMETPNDIYRDYAWKDGSNLCKYGSDMVSQEEVAYQIKNIARNMIKDGDFKEINGEVYKRI